MAKTEESTRSAQIYLLGCRLDGSLVYKKYVTCVVSRLPTVQRDFMKGKHELSTKCHVLKLQPLCDVSKAYFKEFPELNNLVVSPYSKELL